MEWIVHTFSETIRQGLWTNILTHKINTWFKKKKKIYLIVSATERGYVEIHSKTKGCVKIF